MKNERRIKDLLPEGEIRAIACALTNAFKETKTFQTIHHNQLWDIVSGVMVRVENKLIEGELPKVAPIKICFSVSNGFWIFKRTQDHIFYKCSNCGEIIFPSLEFCGQCGQGVDWGKVAEKDKGKV